LSKITFECKALAVNDKQAGHQAVTGLCEPLLLDGGFVGVTNWFVVRTQSFSCKEIGPEYSIFSVW